MLHARRWWTLLLLVGAGLVTAAEPKADDTKLSREEQRILDLTNQAREKEKLPALKINATLLKVARAHAANMAKQRLMEHVLDGKDPTDRVDKAGYDYRSVGENIGAGEKGASIEALFKAWMESKVHHDNIVSPKYDEIGIGLAADEKGEVYYAQVFGKQRTNR